MLKQKVQTLSEGQKGLLSMCCLVLQQPTILILDEPTNHINFRHLKALANAIRTFEGTYVRTYDFIYTFFLFLFLFLMT